MVLTTVETRELGGSEGFSIFGGNSEPFPQPPYRFVFVVFVFRYIKPLKSLQAATDLHYHSNPSIAAPRIKSLLVPSKPGTKRYASGMHCGETPRPDSRLTQVAVSSRPPKRFEYRGETV